jgi:hypothetical protein
VATLNSRPKVKAIDSRGPYSSSTTKTAGFSGFLSVAAGAVDTGLVDYVDGSGKLRSTSGSRQHSISILKYPSEETGQGSNLI